MNVIEELAKSYAQLYIVPGDDVDDIYANVVRKGQKPDTNDLSHFYTNDNDNLQILDTPAGNVLCVTLGDRRDFVTFIRIMANRCKMVDVPDTQGASAISGIINWKKIYNHKDEFLKTLKDTDDPISEWNMEFKRFTSDKANYLDTLIVLSIGPYSAVPANVFGMTDDEWLTASDTIRKYHECTHFICRRLYPDKKEAIWDEVVADAVGIYAAFGRLDTDMEKAFLGIEDHHYSSGRLENYVEEDDVIKKKRILDDLACRIDIVLERFKDICNDNALDSPFDLAIRLEESMDELWNRKI